jgi:glycosyltransferase involved in cell wall biosynthesis
VHPPLDTRIFHREARAAADFGCDVLLIAPGAPGDPVDGIRFASLPSWGGRAGRPFRWPVLFVKAWRARADIYHFHDPELLPWGLLLKWLTGAAVVYDSHEYLKESLRSRHWIPRPLRRPLSAFAGRVEKWVAGHIDAVVAVTEDMADRFRPYQPRTIVVRNLPPAWAAVDAQGPREPVIAYAGLMNAARGLDILFDTARLVHERHPEARFEILGSQEWAGIDATLAALSPAEWEAVGVHFGGTVPFQEVAPRLARASIGWLPRSPHDENNLLAWPNKLVEYMACGLPIVASGLPAQARVLAESDSGIVVEAVSPAAHARAICLLLDDPVEAERLGTNGKRAASTLYTWEREAKKLQSLYNELTSGSP